MFNTNQDTKKQFQNIQPNLNLMNNLTNSILADSILQKAIEKDIAVYENTDLLKMIAKLEVLKNEPEDYYALVTDIVTYIYRK